VATRAEVEEGGERLSLKTRRSPKPYARPKNSKLLNPNPQNTNATLSEGEPLDPTSQSLNPRPKLSSPRP